LIGVLQKGMAIGDAAQTYTKLTVGDGLVTQIPALIIFNRSWYCGNPSFVRSKSG